MLCLPTVYIVGRAMWYVGIWKYPPVATVPNPPNLQLALEYLGPLLCSKTRLANSCLDATIFRWWCLSFDMLGAQYLGITYPKLSIIAQKLWRPDTNLWTAFYYIKYAISICYKLAAGLERRPPEAAIFEAQSSHLHFYNLKDICSKNQLKDLKNSNLYGYSSCRKSSNDFSATSQNRYLSFKYVVVK